MRIDAAYFGPPQGAIAAAHAARKAQLNGLWFPETGHDPFLSVLLASQAEPSLEVGTAIAVGFARSPMTLAQTSWDLASLSGGRFHLGLGTQIKAHVTRRFSMPWHKPVEQMRELMLAIRAIWRSFESGEKLNYEGEYYRLNLLTPYFTPARHDFPKIPIGLAAVGPKMTELAGELADFIVYHTFTNLAYLKETTLPSLQAGLSLAGRQPNEIQRVGSLFVITGDAERQKKMEREVRSQVAFYASTPAYRPVLEAIGCGELQTEMFALSKAGQWEEMAQRVSPEVLEAFAVRAHPSDLAAAIRERYQGVYDRVLVQLSPDDLLSLGEK